MQLVAQECLQVNDVLVGLGVRFCAVRGWLLCGRDLGIGGLVVRQLIQGTGGRGGRRLQGEVGVEFPEPLLCHGKEGCDGLHGIPRLGGVGEGAGGLGQQRGGHFLRSGFSRVGANPFAVQEIADALKGVDIPILIKNPVNPDLELWIGAFERINNAGLKQLGAIHRGFSSYDKKIYRNLPQWHIPIELRRRIPELPIFCDPSHIGGKRELVAPLCQQAMDLGFDGLIVESHCNPDCAWSDAAQQVTPDVLDYILNLLVIRKETQTTENLGELRNQIDDCDNEIIEVLAKRMRVCREIGTFKKEHDMTILQTGRYNEILDKRGAQGSLCGMDSDFIKKVFEAIHEESVRQQMEIINK